MTKYLLKRIGRGILSIIAVVAIVMLLIYGLMDRTLIFANDASYSKKSNNQKISYQYQKWEEYGYLDYVTYVDFINRLAKDGEIDEETRAKVVNFARKEKNDSEEVKPYTDRFRQEYEAMGYTVLRYDAVMTTKTKVSPGGAQQYFAYKNTPLVTRMLKYFTGLFTVDNIHYVEEDIGERGLTFTWKDPVYGGETFSPAIIGNGTQYKYLLYCDSHFPFIHQNLFRISLGTSYTVNQGVDIFRTMTRAQGSFAPETITYPTGLVEESADDLHSATYVAGSRALTPVNEARFSDDYTRVDTMKAGSSKMGYSFKIGILSTLMAYLLGLPLGMLMAKKKNTWVDKLGTVYIVFIIAVPSLAYIFLFKAIGGLSGLPTTFNIEQITKAMYILPVVSLAMPSIANLMKWLRRYMIDQTNADYVKFARSGGLSEGEIFTKHILRNAVIPIVHGIPASVLFALTGAIITERVYVVPGAGNLLTTAINRYDNGVIVGVTLFYAILSVVSVILGDILMSMIDPRISFSKTDR